MVGNKKDTNILISFASFQDDGSVRVKNQSTEEGSQATMADVRMHQKYEEEGRPDGEVVPCTHVRFISLKNFNMCQNVKQFTDMVLEQFGNKKTEQKGNTKAKGNTNLFLQDFPSKGIQRQKYVLKLKKFSPILCFENISIMMGFSAKFRKCFPLIDKK